MSLTIANNSLSLVAQSNLGRSNRAMKQSLERLSSGFKVNRGADGPAALVISEKQRTQIAGLKTAIDNSEKAVSLVQTAEGALNEINSLLVKVRSLALDSANEGVNDADALAANQAEIDNALDTINRIAENTQFTTKKLLDGSAGVNGTPSDADVTFLSATTDTQAGVRAVTVDTAGSKATIQTAAALAANLGQDETLTINGVQIELASGLSRTQVQDRINQFTDQTGVTAHVNTTAGADLNKLRLSSTSYGQAAKFDVISNVDGADADGTTFGTTNQELTGVDVIATIDGIQFNGQGNVVTADAGAARGLSLSFAAVDTGDSAHLTVTGAQGSVTVADDSMIFQIGPNQNQTAKVAIGRTHSSSLGIAVTGNQFANLEEIDVTTAGKAQDALAVIDSAVDDVTNLRGSLGAFQQNTLEATANNLRATLENTVNAESVIRDTDFAAEIAEFTKQQVIQQAGTSVLGNANQIPQLVLSLLG